MKKWSIYIFLITALFNNSCKQPTTNVGQYHQMLTLVDKEISTMLDTVKQHYSVTELVTSGFHELRFKLKIISVKLSADVRNISFGPIKLIIEHTY